MLVNLIHKPTWKKLGSSWEKKPQNVHTNKIKSKAYTYYLFLKTKLLNQPNFPKDSSQLWEIGFLH